MLAEEGKAKAIAFDEIDKAPEEKKRGITIATVGINFFFLFHLCLLFLLQLCHPILLLLPNSSSQNNICLPQD